MTVYVIDAVAGKTLWGHERETFKSDGARGEGWGVRGLTRGTWWRRALQAEQ